MSIEPQTTTNATSTFREAIATIADNIRLGNTRSIETVRRQIETALSSYASEPPVDWHPIETAPKDGRWFLFWNGEHVCVAQFVMGKYFAPQWYHGASTAPATHWMQLPEPPV